MWPDNETERDFLNFTGVADTVAEIIVQANGRPISIGVSGARGVGKSSMIKLVRKSAPEIRQLCWPERQGDLPRPTRGSLGMGVDSGGQARVSRSG